MEYSAIKNFSLIKFNESYSPKIDLKILLCSQNEMPVGSYYVEIRKLFYDNKRPLTNELKKYITFLSIYNYFKKERIEYSYIIEILNKLNVDYNDNVLRYFFDNLENINQIEHKISYIIRNVLLKEIFGTYSLMFASFMCNAILFKNNYYPFVFSYNDYAEIKRDLILLNESDNYIIQKILKLQELSVFYSKKYPPITKEEIINTIVERKGYLLSKQIYSIYLYGSFFRGDETEFSDIDFIIVTDDKKYEKKELNQLLQPLFNRRVDVHADNDVNPNDMLSASLKIY